MSENETEELQSNLKGSAIQGSGKRIVDVIKEDPDDDDVLSAALETQADYIVTGDAHLLDLGSYHGIDIVSPARFLEILGEATSADA